MTRAEHMARWAGANVSCCNPFERTRDGFDLGSDDVRARCVALSGEVIAALEAFPAEQRAGMLATDVKLRAAITCGCEFFRGDPWAELSDREQQHLRIMAARWLGALEAA